MPIGPLAPVSSVDLSPVLSRMRSWRWWARRHPCLSSACARSWSALGRLPGGAKWLNSGQKDVSGYNLCCFQTGSQEFPGGSLPMQMSSRMALTVTYKEGGDIDRRGLGPWVITWRRAFNWVCSWPTDKQENKLPFS